MKRIERTDIARNMGQPPASPIANKAKGPLSSSIGYPKFYPQISAYAVSISVAQGNLLLLVLSMVWGIRKERAQRHRVFPANDLLLLDLNFLL